jgi:hypothetical protein
MFVVLLYLKKLNILMLDMTIEKYLVNFTTMGTSTCIAVLVFIAPLVISLGAIAGGSYMCYASKITKVCADWSLTPEYSTHKCVNAYTKSGVLIECGRQLAGTNTSAVCACYHPLTAQLECPPGLPPGISPSLMTGGFFIVLAGVIILVVTIVCYCRMGK